MTALDLIAPVAVPGIRVMPVLHERVDFAGLVRRVLNQLDPASYKIDWDTTTSQLVGIFVQAQLADGSAKAQIACTTLGALKSHTIPAGATALLPTPTNANPLIITTTAIGFNPKGGSHAWGTDIIAVGRGGFGVSCRTPAGACPPK